MDGRTVKDDKVFFFDVNKKIKFSNINLSQASVSEPSETGRKRRTSDTGKHDVLKQQPSTREHKSVK